MRFDVREDKSVHAELTIPQPYQGWRDVAHGGIVALVLDEAMAYAAAAHGYLGVTADLKMRFRQAVPVGEVLAVRGKVLWQRRNIFGIEASVCDARGRLLASGEGRFVSRGKLASGQRLGDPRTNGRA